jgi:RimJ/RimL family protein N-acetyltransferase
LSNPPIEVPVEGLSDGVVRLRLQTEADIEVMVPSLNDPAIQRYTTVVEGYAAKDAEAWQAESEQHLAEGLAVALMVADAKTDEPLGGIGGRRNHADPGRWTLGYLVYPQARGRGVATRAVRLLAAYLFDELAAARLEVQVEPDNRASLAVAESVGFQREGIQRAYQEIKGTRRDMVTLSLLPGEIIG